MLIVCPSCATSYSLTEEQLGRGRTLRCAQCRHTWFASPEGAAEALIPNADLPAGDEGASAPAPEQAPPPPVRKVAAKPKARSSGPSLKQRLKAVRPWQAACAAALLALGLAVAQRKAVVQAAPQTARLFAAIGLPVNLRGITFDEVRSQLLMESEQSALVVEGEIRNVTRGETQVPPLRVSLRNADGREIYSWTTEAPRNMLAAGKSAQFRTRLVAPPLDGRDVLVRFARDETSAAPAH